MIPVPTTALQTGGHGTTVRMALARDRAAALRAVLGDQEVGHSCPRCASSEHGVPYLRSTRVTGRRLSISHADGWTLVALADGQVGVDIELPGSLTESQIAAHLAPSEQAADPTRTWVRKEAVLKAEGVGLTRDPRQVDVSYDETVGSPYDVVDVELDGLVCAVAAHPPIVIVPTVRVGAEAPATASDRATAQGSPRPGRP